MKRTLFNVRLYLDGLRQLRIIGILFTILIGLVTAVIPVMRYLDTLDWDEIAPVGIDYLQMNPLVILLFCAVAPLMTLYLFSFLNKRNSSDFYHAFPANRECVFLSLFASVSTWIAGILLISSLVSVVTYGIFPQLYTVNYTSILLVSLNTFAGAVFIAAAVAIAMTVTGTVFTNLLVALILIFFPRLLLELVISGIQSAFPLVRGLEFVPLLSSRFNVPVGFVFSIFVNGTFNGGLTQWSSGIYTLVVGLLYTAIATILFVKRRSESAGQSAPSRLLQGLYRFLVGFVISCIATSGLFQLIMDGYSLDTTDLFSMLLVYLVAFLAALTFEVLCTRKFRGLIRKGGTTVLLLAVANLVFFFGMLGMGRAMYAYTPDAEDIQSVSFTTGLDDTYFYGSYRSRQEYFVSKTAKVKLNDPEILKIVSRQLDYSVDLLEISRKRFDKEASNAQLVTVTIRDGLFEHKRHVLMYSEDIETLSKRLYTIPEYRAAYGELPETISSVDIEFNYRYEHLSTYKNDKLNEFYTVFKQEFSALDFETRYALLHTPMSYEDTSFANLGIDVLENGQWYYFNVPLSLEQTPKTAEWFIRYFNETENAKDGLQTLVDNFDQLEEITFVLYDQASGRLGETRPLLFANLIPEQKDHIKAELNAMLAANATETVTVEAPFYYVTGYVQRYNGDPYKGDGYYYSEENYGFMTVPGGGRLKW